MQKLFYRILVVISFLFIIIFPKETFNGALSGLKLWSETILPGLFPAMIVTSCILCLFPMKSRLAYFYIMAAGLLCGFPVGAFLCSSYHQQNNETICTKLMAFCNMSSPSFIINYIFIATLKNTVALTKLLLCIYLPAIEAAVFILFMHRKEIYLSNTSPKASCGKAFEGLSQMMDSAIWGAIQNMLKLGGYIVVFSCISAYICMLPIKNPLITAVICGITEITNGIYLIGNLKLPDFYKTVLILAVNAFGGLSTIMQTAGITKNSGLSIQNYVCSKLLLAILTVAHCLVLLH